VGKGITTHAADGCAAIACNAAGDDKVVGAALTAASMVADKVFDLLDNAPSIMGRDDFVLVE